MSRFAHLFHGLMSCRMWLTDDREWKLLSPMTEREWLLWHFPKDGPAINFLTGEDEWDDDEDDEDEVATGPPALVAALAAMKLGEA